MTGLSNALKYYLLGITYILTGQFSKALELANKNPFEK